MAKKVQREIKEIPEDVYMPAKLCESRDIRDQTLYVWFGEENSYHSSFLAGYIEPSKNGFTAYLTRELCRFFGEVPSQEFKKESEAKKYLVHNFYSHLDKLATTLKKECK